MFLGARTIWRAQSRVSLVQGFSPVPREPRNLLLASRIQAGCWLSSSVKSPSPAEGLQNAGPRKLVAAADEADAALQIQAEKKTAIVSARSPAARGRLFLRRLMKSQKPGPHATVLIKRPIRYPDHIAAYRRLRKHRISLRRQVLHDYARNATGKPAHDWRTTLDFMLRYTPKFGEILDFKVGVGSRTAAQALASLSELDTNLWQIQQRHHCRIHVESGLQEGEPLILSLSGTTVSVRESLLEIVRTVGKVSAVRVLDPTLQISTPKMWEGSRRGQLPIQLLGDEDSTSEDDIVTVYGHNTDLPNMTRPPKHKTYKLTTRADEIPRPTDWTTSSFEQYVAKLVFARVPTHLHKSLYPVGLDHQSTVVQLLTELFTSEDLRAAMSAAALKMALRFMLTRGPKFRPAARIIFYQAQLQHLSLDAGVFQNFLVSASRAGDLNSFNSFMRAMHRSGHYIRAETWTAFLDMIKDPQIKDYIMKKMKARGLHRLQPILEELGRQTVILDLERSPSSEISIQRLLDDQDKRYGRSWLNTITLNKMIDVLGARRNLEACQELLDLVDRDGRARPDQYTLNTMMTHTRSLPQKIALLSRWPGLEPDGVTYDVLFGVAWRRRLPNMLRVIWRYGAFARLINSHMRHTLTALMRPEPNPSKRRAFLKAWQGAILGRSKVAADGSQDPDGSRGIGAAQLIQEYLKDAGSLQPLVRFEVKLQEAYEMDSRIHKLHTEGAEVTPSLRASLTVNIPLGVKKQEGNRSSSGETRRSVKPQEA